MPFAAAVPALIGAAGSIGGALLSKSGSSQAPALSAEAKQAQTGLLGNMGTAQNYQNLLQPYMTSFYNQAQQGIASPMDYYAKLLSGDRAAMTQAIAPEAQAIGSNYATAARTAQTTMPRGGYASTTMANLPFMQANSINTLLQQLRPQAAAAMGNLALGAGQLGTSAGGNMLNALGLSNQAGQGVLGTGTQQQGNLMNYQMGQQQNQYQFGQNLGQTLSNIPWDKIFKGGGSKSAGSTAGMSGSDLLNLGGF